MAYTPHPTPSFEAMPPASRAWGRAVIWVSVLLAILGFFSIILTLPEIGGVQVKWVVPLLDGILLGFVVWLLTQKKVSVKVFVAAVLVVIIGPLLLTLVAIIVLTAIF